MNLCYAKYCIERPEIVLLIVPIFFILLIILTRDFIKFNSVDEKKAFRKKNRWFRLYLIITRTLMFLMILIAFAFPFSTEDYSTNGKPVAKLLVDNTESMNIFKADTLESVKKKLDGKLEVELGQISSGKRSELGDGILKHMTGNDNILLLTDGANNYGKNLVDVGIYASMSDTKLFAIDLEPEKNDAYVEITGPAETIEGTPNQFLVRVKYVGAQPAFTLQVSVDDKIVFSGQNVYEKEVIQSFGRGYHKMTAKIILKDHFSENNIFYKTIKAVPKPKILLVTSGKNPIEEGLKSIYELKVSQTLPAKISDYSAIVFDDVTYSSIGNRVDDLTGFLLNGGGILFIGGKNSFDKGGYKDTLLESMLPVKIGTGKVIEPIQNNIIILLDVSDSFGNFGFKKGSKETTLDFGKGLAVKMVEDFRDDINVGLVVFATTGQIVSEPVPLKDNKQSLIGMIKRLQNGEGTQINNGLVMAEKALDNVKGTKNVILISDGKMGKIKEPRLPVTIAQRMASKGIRIYTVGLPTLLSNDDTDINRHLMTKLADIGSGSYFEPSDSQFLNVYFGKPETKDKIFSGSSNLAIMDKEHFITKDLKVNAMVTGVNFVVPKLGSKNLIFTGDGNPVLNTWNFGLGRVVTFATDDGREWAGQILTKENSMLLTRMVNYAVGNPERGKEVYVDAKDGYLGEENKIIVKSAKYPTSAQLTFAKDGQDLYSASFSPDKEGFYQFFDTMVAINPPREYYGLGVSNRLRDMVELSGGKMLKMDDKDLVSQIMSMTKRNETKRTDLKFYPLAIALAIFIIELFIRKIYEHKRYRVKV